MCQVWNKVTCFCKNKVCLTHSNIMERVVTFLQIQDEEED